MENNLQQLSSILQDIKGNGTFAISGSKDAIIPGLYINELEEISFPINTDQCKSIIKESSKAPFGKGSKTIIDESIRNVWEVDASAITFQNPQWSIYLNKIIDDVKKGLGFGKHHNIKANLYKLLVYEKGSFFLPHKDSEKEVGMFGSLVIGLPSTYTGGELIINFDNRTHQIDFSKDFKNYKLPYTAFFADCEHEIKPVISGYRICLVYNLINNSPNSGLNSPKFSLQQNKITSILSTSFKKFNRLPKAILLGHEYTPANFSLENLKGHDKPRAEAILNAAKEAGYHAQLALVTHYQNGALEGDYDYYDNYYSNKEPENGSMGEVFDEYTYIKHWDNKSPGLGDLYLEQKDVIADLNLGEGNPTEQDEEGYTGNAGMTIEYWYHYGAIVLWPKIKHIKILKTRPINNQLEWLEYYLKKSVVPNSKYIHLIRDILIGLSESHVTTSYRNALDLNILSEALVYINDISIVDKFFVFLSKNFDNINTENWCSLIKNYDSSTFEKIFFNVGASNDLYKIGHLIGVINKLSQEQVPLISPMLEKLITNIPNYLSSNDIQNVSHSSQYYNNIPVSRIEIAIQLTHKILHISNLKNNDNIWNENVTKQLTKSLSRRYLNKTLVKVLLESKNKTPLFDKLKAICIQELTHKTKEKPQPPSNWTRKVPKSTQNATTWNMLAAFLNSPTDHVYEYRANQQLRQVVKNAIDNVSIDLRTETIEKGRPYTLKITKTQQEYERLLKYWEEDTLLLKQIQKI